MSDLEIRDEYEEHVNAIMELAKKYTRIVLFGSAGCGKSTILFDVERRLRATGSYDNWWMDSDTYPLPLNHYISTIVSLSMLEDQELFPIGNRPDVVYCVEYSVEYKEMVTGFSFATNKERPLKAYYQQQQNMCMHQIKGQSFSVAEANKRMDELKKEFISAQ